MSVERGALSHLFAHVGDYDAARRFWVDQLGLEVLMEGGGYLRVGGGDGFHIGIEEAPADRAVEIVVRVADVDATAERLRAAGIEVGDPFDAPWGARYASLRDPDGRAVSIQSPLRGAQDRP